MLLTPLPEPNMLLLEDEVLLPPTEYPSINGDDGVELQLLAGLLLFTVRLSPLPEPYMCLPDDDQYSSSLFVYPLSDA